MQALIHSIPAAPGRDNEDFAAFTADAAVLLDGAGTPAGSDSGCVHGVAWYSHTLGGLLLARLATGADLRSALAEAIEQVASLHGRTCDLAHPGSPSATVLAVRRDAGRLDYLVLADSVLLLRNRSGDTEAITDDREAIVGRRYRQPMDSLPANGPAHTAALRQYVEQMRAHRNTAGGFWVASVDPAAATESVTGSRALEDLADLALLSDGASRLVDRFDLATWSDAMEVLAGHGPRRLMERVRAAEDSDPLGRRWPRGKVHDDATALYVPVAPRENFPY